MSLNTIWDMDLKDKALVSLSVLQLCFGKRFRPFPYNTLHWFIRIQWLSYWHWLESEGEVSVMPVEPTGWKLDPVEAIQTHESSTSSNKRTRLSDWFSLFIHFLIVLLFITPRCAVCVGVTAESSVMVSSAVGEQSWCSRSASLQHNGHGNQRIQIIVCFFPWRRNWHRAATPHWSVQMMYCHSYLTMTCQNVGSVVMHAKCMV